MKFFQLFYSTLESLKYTSNFERTKTFLIKSANKAQKHQRAWLFLTSMVFTSHDFLID